MQFNASTGYALQIMLYLTKNRRIVSSMELKENIEISQRYLFQITGKLRSGGLIETRIGVNGGCALFKEPSLISTYDVIKLMEGGVYIPESVITAVCIKTGMDDILKLLTEYMKAYFRSMTLNKLTGSEINEWHAEFTNTIEMHIATLNQKIVYPLI